MELERMHHQSQATNGVPRARRVPGHSAGMEHLNLSIPLHVQVPPLPSPNTTAAAAALFRVNQLPPAASTPDAAAGNTSAFSFKSPSSVSLKKRQRLLDSHGHGLGIYAPPGTPTMPSQPTPTTAAAAAAAMALSASSPASAASMEQYEQNKRAMMLAAASNHANTTNNTNSANNTNAHALSPTDAESGPEMRRRKVGIPKFLRYLFQMLEYEDNAVIAWSHDGAAFQIRDPEELAERVLPKYFKHNKVSSFQRQLNYFGFKKWTKTQTNICTFSHPCFHRDEQDKMRLIKRKERSTRGSNETNKANKTEHATHEDDDDVGGDEDEESDDHHAVAKAPPAKRAKLTKQQPAKRPSPTTMSLALESVATVGEPTPTPTPTPTSAAPRGRGRPPTSAGSVKKEPKAKAAKPPRGAKKSPTQNQYHEPDGEPPSCVGTDERAPASRANANKSARKLQLPTISPTSLASSSSSASSVSASSGSLSRLVSHSASPSPTHAMYARMSGDAAPVLPVHSELMLQQQQQQQQTNAFLRRFPSGPYDSGGSGGGPSPLQDLSEAFGSSGSGSGGSSGTSGGWGSQHGVSGNDTYGLSTYKFPDPTDFAYGSNSGPTGNGPNGPNGSGGSGSGSGNGGGGSGGHGMLPSAKDYLDVLLESANMDDPHLSAPSAAWEASYQPHAHQQQHHAHAFGRGDPDAAMATFHMLSVPHHQHQHQHPHQQQHGSATTSTNGMQLPSIEDLQGAGRY